MNAFHSTRLSFDLRRGVVWGVVLARPFDCSQNRLDHAVVNQRWGYTAGDGMNRIDLESLRTRGPRLARVTAHTIGPTGHLLVSISRRQYIASLQRVA